MTSQGEAQRNPGINASNHILYDSHRDDGVSVETDGIVVAMTFPHSRNIIALANMSFRAGTPYPSMPVMVNVVRRLIPRVTLRFTLACHGVIK